MPVDCLFRLLLTLEELAESVVTVKWDGVFDNYGEKVVAKNDKNKGAYLPSKRQRTAIEAAGIEPKQGVGIDIAVLFEPNISSVDASYYYSARSEGAGRTPEPRMGREFISSWLSVGDRVLIGNIGAQIFAARIQRVRAGDDEIIAEVVGKARRETILDRAKSAKGKPSRRTVQRNDFVRNPYVVAAAIIRSNGKCEMPNCTRDLFSKDDGSPYLEVHHVHPLAEGGDDTLVNAAALCPHCHRFLHFGLERRAMRATLAASVAAIAV